MMYIYVYTYIFFVNISVSSFGALIFLVKRYLESLYLQERLKEVLIRHLICLDLF